MMMNLKPLLKLCLSGLFFLSSLSSATAKPVLEEIAQTGLLKVAIREDAVPFGYRDFDNNLSGICLDLINIIAEEVRDTLKQEIISIRLFKSSLFNRFSLIEDGVVHLECGPNTIRAFNRERQIQFSEPFFVTGTQLLIKAENADNINLNGSLENVTVGVLRGSTNRRLIRRRYPKANLQNFLGITGRLRGIQALQEGRVDAFASDGILLIGEAVLEGLVLGRDYLLIPPDPLECDYYGLILPTNAPQWESLVNRSIKIATEREVFREWLGVILPEIRQGFQSCGELETTEEDDQDESF